MNAFRNIDALLLVISREKALVKFLFTSRKSPSLRREQALENFLGQDERRLTLLLEHGVVQETERYETAGEDGTERAGKLSGGGRFLVLADTYLRFFEDVLEVNEEINVLSVKQHIDALNEQIELWLTVGTDARRHRYMEAILHILRNIALSTYRNVIDLKRNIEGAYKNERDFKVKRKRLEGLDRKRSDIALLIKEAERVMQERQPTFFSVAMDVHLKEVVTAVKASLTESYHSLLELDRQIIIYLNKIEAEQKLVEKIRRVKYLKDQLVWEKSTDVIWALHMHRPVFLEKRPWMSCPPSLCSLTSRADGIAALRDAHAALRSPVARRKVEAAPLTAEELSPGAVVQDMLNTFEIRNAFVGSSKDLMSFLQEREGSLSSAKMMADAPEREPSLSEERLNLFCRLAAEFYDDFRISGEYRDIGQYSYPLIWPG